jgi:hypothetical protein
MWWDIIKLNLPGNPESNPSKPRVITWEKTLKKIAGDILGFADDLHT